MNIKNCIIIAYFIITIAIFSSCNQKKPDILTAIPTHTHRMYLLPYIFVTKWGSKGYEDGQFNGTNKIAVNTKGELYVSDDKIETRKPVVIVKPTSNGKFVTEYVCDKKVNFCIQKFDSNGNFIKKWRLDYKTYSIATDSRNYVYIIGYGDRMHIQKFDPNDNFVKKFGKEYEQEETQAYSVGVDSKDYVYVANSAGNLRESINKYDSNGNFIVKLDCGTHQLQQTLGDITIDSLDYIYVVESTFSPEDSSISSAIYKLDQSGKVINWWSTEGEKNFSTGYLYITKDLQGNILVSSPSDNKIRLFDSNGVFISEFGSKGERDGQFKNPRGITVDSEGNLYVADTGNYRIQKFKPNPEFKLK